MLSLAAVQALAEEPVQKRKLSFGVVLGLSGYAAEHSSGMKNGILLAVDHLKRDGWQVDFKVEDDETNPAKTVSAIRSLLARDYRLFVGPTWSFQIRAAEPILRSAGALAITPGGSSVINGGASEAILNMCPRRDKQTPNRVSLDEAKRYQERISPYSTR